MRRAQSVGQICLHGEGDILDSGIALFITGDREYRFAGTEESLVDRFELCSQCRKSGFGIGVQAFPKRFQTGVEGDAACFVGDRVPDKSVRRGTGYGDLRRVVDEPELHFGQHLTDEVDDRFLVVEHGLRQHFFGKRDGLFIFIRERLEAHGRGGDDIVAVACDRARDPHRAGVQPELGLERLTVGFFGGDIGQKGGEDA